MLYPLKFRPILKTVVWGGDKIAPFKGIETSQHEIGESWELSGVKDHESVVANGSLSGRTITELVQEYKGVLLGQHVYENSRDEFPLLVKFIDAKDDLSIQVHPDDELAEKRHATHGKTEMWYVIGADEGASLMSGLSKGITPEEYAERVENHTITDVLARYEVKSGDVFFLPAGRIHTICAGCFIAEIQQTSDITYRIYDYNRPGLDGKPRELHTELAKDAIDYTVCPDHRTHYIPNPDGETEVVKCKYFETSVIDIKTPFIKDLSELDSFVVLVCIEGNGVLYDTEILNDGPSKGHTISISRGETILIPASSTGIRIVPKEGMKIVASWIP